ncbi:MAG: polysulfide reductase NrfD [Planctomycetes bacterium]|nr:polysulfide reductase NrfD [Planctomycetota bacterium]
MSGNACSPLREPLVLGGKKLGDITQDVCGSIEGKPSTLWWFGFLLALTVAGIGAATMGYQIYTGIGTWGLNKTVGWAFDITNFVFWVGIGHAGTLISAILCLFRQKWRTSVNRSAEAMTIFAVICAAIFPFIHMGRPWFGAFWALPYPNFRGPLWVNFRSPLLWDVFAISTYFTISLVFWFIGLIPDNATVRDRAKHWLRRAFYGTVSLGWDGSVKKWNHYETAYLIFAGLSTPLVVSVHTIVSMDFATSVIPGWHTTIFPPYFVIGAIFSGFAMVQTLLLVARKTMRLESYITVNHLEVMAKIILLTGSLVGLAYGTEFFIAWYSGSQYEQFAFINRATGPFSWAYWIMVSCNVLSPQVLWFRALRRNPVVLFIMSIFVNIGMWFERFVIIVTSLHRDFLPSSWSYYTPTWVEAVTFIGTFGIFFTCFFLFIRLLPAIAFGEVKGVMKWGQPKGHSHDAGHSHAHGEVKHA